MEQLSNCIVESLIYTIIKDYQNLLSNRIEDKDIAAAICKDVCSTFLGKNVKIRKSITGRKKVQAPSEDFKTAHTTQTYNWVKIPEHKNFMYTTDFVITDGFYPVYNIQEKKVVAGISDDSTRELVNTDYRILDVRGLKY